MLKEYFSNPTEILLLIPLLHVPETKSRVYLPLLPDGMPYASFLGPIHILQVGLSQP